MKWFGENSFSVVGDNNLDLLGENLVDAKKAARSKNIMEQYNVALGQKFSFWKTFLFSHVIHLVM